MSENEETTVAESPPPRVVYKNPSVNMKDYGFCAMAVKFEQRALLRKLRLYRSEPFNVTLQRVFDSSRVVRAYLLEKGKLLKKRKRARRKGVK